MKKTILIAGIIGIVAVAIAAWLQMRSPDLQALRDNPKVMLLEQPEPITKDFNLRDHKNNVFDKKRLQGQWSLMFFGYTSCPDVCPPTMLVMQQVSRHFQPEKLQYVFVSVDSERDTVKVLNEFINAYGENITGVRGEVRQIDALTQQVFVNYEIDRADDGSVKEVMHTTSILLVDPQGRLRASFYAPHEAGTITDAVKKIMHL